MKAHSDPGTSRAPLVDTHAHLDLYPEPIDVIRETVRARVLTIAVSNAPSVFRALGALTDGASSVRPALGLHPELAFQRHLEIELFESLLGETSYIGEVGLDYVTPSASERAVQRRVFERIVGACDRAGEKVLTIHSRRAVADVVDTIGPNFRGKWILHWYSGSAAALRRAVSWGAYVSVNTAMIRSDRARSLLAEIPMERLLTESDGPFVSVETPEGARFARPSDVEVAVAGLAELRGIEADEMREGIYQNFIDLTRKPGASRTTGF